MSTPLYHSTPRMPVAVFGDLKALNEQADRQATETALAAMVAMRAIRKHDLDERVAALLINEVRWLVEHSAWADTEHGTDAGDQLCDVVLLLENAAGSQA